jgi:hypothetical protein
VVRTGGFKNLLEVAFGWPCASLEIAFDHHHKLLVRVPNFIPTLPLLALTAWQHKQCFYPLFPPLEPFLVPLTTILGDAVRL